MTPRLVAKRVHSGANRFSRQPLVELRVAWPENARVDAERWSALRTMLGSHHAFSARPGAMASLGEAVAGGESISPSDAAKRLALALQRAFDRSFDRVVSTAATPEPAPQRASENRSETHSTIVYPFIDPVLASAVGQVAIDAMALVLAPQALDGAAMIARALDGLANWSSTRGLSGTQSGVALEARRRGIPAWRVGTALPVLGLGYGARQQWLWRGSTTSTPHVGVTISTHKNLANQLLREAGLPVPAQALVEDLEQARRAAARIGYPVVTKPSSTDQGVGITTSISNDDELAVGFRRAREHGAVLVEKHIDGADHRLTVIGGRLWRAARREPAHVVGNGRDSIAELVRQANVLRAADAQLRDFPLHIDEEGSRLLTAAGLTPESVPADGAYVRLKTNANLSTGGTLRTVDALHPDNALLAERAAATLGLDIAGIDFITTDATRSWVETGAAICEINATPAIRRESDAPAWILRAMFPGDDQGRIPIAMVAGPPDRARSVATILAERLRAAGRRVALACDGRVTVDGKPATRPGMSSWAAAKVAVHDRLVNAAVVATTITDALDQGLAFDRCELAVVLGGDNHPQASGMQAELVRVLRNAADEVMIDPDANAVAGWRTRG